MNNKITNKTVQLLHVAIKNQVLRPNSAIYSGDRILLCTDGLCGYVSDDVIASALQSTDDDMKVIESLMESVYDVGAGDNVTIVVGTI